MDKIITEFDGTSLSFTPIGCNAYYVTNNKTLDMVAAVMRLDIGFKVCKFKSGQMVTILETSLPFDCINDAMADRIAKTIITEHRYYRV